MIKGSKHTEEMKKQISRSVRKALASEDTKRRMSNAHRGERNAMFGKTHSLEARKKISMTHKGKIVLPDVRRKISDGTKGEKNHNFGKCFSEEHRKRISMNHRDSSGENNPGYKDGRCGTKEYEPCRAAQKRAHKLRQTPSLTRIEEGRIKFIYTVASTMADVHVDHIIPLSRGGLHHPENLQILDGRLNDSKKNKWPLTEDETRRFQGLRLWKGGSYAANT